MIRCIHSLFLAVLSLKISAQTSPYLGVAEHGACAITIDHGLQCWGLGVGGLNHPPKSVKASPKVFVGTDMACAFEDQDSLFCWGYLSREQDQIPYQKSDLEGLFFDDSRACLKLRGKLDCWGGGTTEHSITLVKPSAQIINGRGDICTLVDGRVACYPKPFEAPDSRFRLENLSKLLHFSSSRSSYCATRRHEAWCWAKSGFPLLSFPVHNPQGIAHNAYITCVLDDGVLICKSLAEEVGSPVPRRIQEPVLIQAGITEVCYQDGHSFHCSLSHIFEPSFLDSFPEGMRIKLPPDYQPRPFSHRCFIKDARVYCLGSGNVAQLGYKTLEPVTQFKDARAVDLGKDFQAKKVLNQRGRSCALAVDGRIACWGQLGHISIEELGPGIVDFSMGDDFVCIVRGDGGVVCTGENFGKVPLVAAEKIFSGGNNTCLLTKEDRVHCFGTSTESLPSEEIAGVKTVAMGSEHGCALKKDETVVCWGNGTLGQLVRGETQTSTKPEPADLGSLPPASDLSCGYNHCCIKTVSNTIKCWGANGFGQLGYGDTLNRGNAPETAGDNISLVRMPPGESLISVEAFDDSTCAQTKSGKRCWGYNGQGQLGYGDMIQRGATPTTIPIALPILDEERE